MSNFEMDEIVISLPWEVICAAACQSMISGLSFEEFIRQCVAAAVNKGSK